MANLIEGKRFGDLPPATMIYGDERIPMESRQRGPDVYLTPAQLWTDWIGPIAQNTSDLRYALLGHTHTVAQISDMTELGRALATAFSPLQARVAIGAQAQVPEATEAEAVAGTVLDMRLWSPRMIAIAAAQHGGGGGGTGLVPMTEAEAVAGVSTAQRSISPAVLRAGVDARIAGVVTPVRPTLHLDFTRRALDPRITFTRASEAWEYNAAGVLMPAATNVWREGHAGGVPQGRAVYQALTNKVTARKSNPIDTTGVFTTTPSDVSIALASDPSRLEQAGAQRVCSNGMVYEATCPASVASPRWIYVTGQAGNTNQHTAAVLARVLTGQASLRFSDQASPSVAIPLSDQYASVSATGTPGTAGRSLAIVIWPGSTVRFILPQFVEAPFPGPIIPGDTLAATTRAADQPSMPLGDWYNPREGCIVVELTPSVPNAFAFCVALYGQNPAGNYIGMGYHNSNVGPRQTFWRANFAESFQLPSAAFLPFGARGKLVLAWRGQDLAIANSASPTVATGTAPYPAPIVSHLAIGNQSAGGGFPANMGLHEITVYPSMPSAAEIQALARL